MDNKQPQLSKNGLKIHPSCTVIIANMFPNRRHRIPAEQYPYLLLSTTTVDVLCRGVSTAGQRNYRGSYTNTTAKLARSTQHQQPLTLPFRSWGDRKMRPIHKWQSCLDAGSPYLIRVEILLFEGNSLCSHPRLILMRAEG